MQEEPKQTINIATIAPNSGDTITLLEALGILWRHKFLLLQFVLLGTVIGVVIGFWIRPGFTSDALLQIDVRGNKSGNVMSKTMGDMGALFDVTSPADAEIELLKSRMVLNYVVQEENLMYSATPVNKLNRLLHREGRMDLEELHIPEVARTDRWTAVATGANSFKVMTPEGAKLLEGDVGELLSAPYAGDTLKIMVKLMRAKEGELFVIRESNPLAVVRGLSHAVSAAEKGKQTGIISVHFTHRYPDRAASILNSVVKTYVRQNVEMRSAEAEKTLEFLEAQLPGVKAKLDSAEKVLADYRHSIGSVDMTGETRAHLEKEVDLQKQIIRLEQEKQEATRLFKEEHPTVRTIVKQQNQLRAELAKLKANAEKLPLTQQEVLRLQEEVQVNNEVYTTMLNNIQQLRVVRAGEVGNVRIVDYAQIEPTQSKPKKFNIMLCASAAGFMVGVLLIFLFQMMRNGVRSVSEVERETNISVYAKIPYSPHRILRTKRMSKVSLIEAAPQDPACEAFRSLQTALDFSLSGGQKLVMVCGLVPGVGKSFVSKNLATVYALHGKKVLLVDADIRRGVIRSSKHRGLSEVLSGKENWRDVVVPGTCENLFVMGCGGSVMAPSELLRHEHFRNLLEEMRSEYDLVLIDTPPLDLVTDAEIIYPLVDFTLIVLRYRRHSMEQIKETINTLKRYGERPCAFAMNRCEYDSGYYYHGYYGGYGHYNRYGR